VGLEHLILIPLEVVAGRIGLFGSKSILEKSDKFPHGSGYRLRHRVFERV